MIQHNTRYISYVIYPNKEKYSYQSYLPAKLFKAPYTGNFKLIHFNL